MMFKMCLGGGQEPYPGRRALIGRASGTSVEALLVGRFEGRQHQWASAKMKIEQLLLPGFRGPVPADPMAVWECRRGPGPAAIRTCMKHLDIKSVTPYRTSDLLCSAQLSHIPPNTYPEASTLALIPLRSVNS
ncbi:hypothetical protein O1611_g7270 [Lasiodiplodia mahajangana]|uniref:Uncharacterized protein n=1 Tax=Lasiodiplodia mahajangana TaxID=1108764 RepID=A0ACC2JG68_9PEZI|nr:hypothetical protein O1611_g7270 [Lasiodiplodia mahajangana]